MLVYWEGIVSDIRPQWLVISSPLRNHHHLRYPRCFPCMEIIPTFGWNLRFSCRSHSNSIWRICVYYFIWSTVKPLHSLKTTISQFKNRPTPPKRKGKQRSSNHPSGQIMISNFPVKSNNQTYSCGPSRSLITRPDRFFLSPNLSLSRWGVREDVSPTCWPAGAAGFCRHSAALQGLQDLSPFACTSWDPEGIFDEWNILEPQVW